MSLLRAPARAAAIGAAGRRRVLQDYSWDAHLAPSTATWRVLCADQPLAA